jgi:hypothetical protein
MITFTLWLLQLRGKEPAVANGWAAGRIATHMPETNLGHPARSRSLQKAKVESHRHLL